MKQLEVCHRLRPLILAHGGRYFKYRNIKVRPAVEGEIIVTVTSDGKETQNTARSGDWVAENQTGAREQYVIPADKLAKRYLPVREPAGAHEAAWTEYKPKGEVFALAFDPAMLGPAERLPDPLEFEAPWGETVVCKSNQGTGIGPDMLCIPLEGDTPLNEVYRIGRTEFDETYRRR